MLKISLFFARHAFWCLLLWVAIASPAFAAGNIDPNAPIHVEADRMVSKQKENAVIFTGDVAAKQGILSIYADEMTVYHENPAANADKPEPPQQIKKLVATGNVKIVQEGLVATGNRMEFFADKRQVLLTGNTKVWQDNNLVTGDKILLDLNTDTTIVEPDKKGGGRVKAFFYPDEKK